MAQSRLLGVRGVKNSRSWIRLLLSFYLLSTLWFFNPSGIQAADTVVFLSPSSASVPNGAQFTVEIRITGAVNLNTVDLRISFIPSILQVVDVDSSTTGVQIQPGNIFPSDNPLFNSTNNSTGVINYSIVGFSSGAFAGDGLVATITFQAVGGGTSPLNFDYLVLTDPDSNELGATAQGGSITVTVEATPTFTPSPTNIPTSTLTPSPSATPTITNTPTDTPTPTITLTPSVTNTPVFADLPVILKNLVIVPTPTQTSTATSTPTQTPTGTQTLTPSPSCTPSVTPTGILTPPPSVTFTPSATLTGTPVPTLPPPTWTPIPSPTPTWYPGACLDLIVNGDCESDEGWYFPITEYTAGYSTLRYHGPTGRSIRTGIESGSPKHSYSAAEQSFDVPLDADQMTLTFWYYCIAATTGPGTEGDHGDRAYVMIIDQYGYYHYLLSVRWPETNQQVWIRAQFDESVLSTFRGQRVTLHFETANNSYGRILAMYLDDISFEVCKQP